MLEIEGRRPTLVVPAQERIMPVDFAAYLIDASPPGFGFYNIRNELKFRRAAKEEAAKKAKGELKNSVIVRPCSEVSHGFEVDSSADKISKAFADYCKVADSNSEVSVLNSNCDHHTSRYGDQTQRDDATDATRSGANPSPRSGKKRVCFADDLGLALERVRIMSESSSTPPRLRPDILSSLTQGAQAGVNVTPPLKLNFQQPASNYLEFRQRLESNCVSLENVILKDYTLMGTIKVKNITFEKEVFLRCTFDSWATYKDITATYAPNSTSGSWFDTFSFTVSVPADINLSKKVMFCVCYRADKKEYWDSNDGKNYEVVSADWKANHSTTHHCTSPRDEATIYSSDCDRDWTVYSSWAERDSSVPYY